MSALGRKRTVAYWWDDLSRFDCLSENDQIPVGRTDHQLALTVELIDRPSHVTFRKQRKPVADLLKDDPNVSDIDVVGVASVR